MIDFVDMLYLAIDKVPAENFPKYDVVVVDELQDLNPLQKMIIERLIAPHGRFIGAGDEKQAIYSFQGSNLQSFKAFQERPFTTTLPLSVCYRCGTKIIEKANTVFNNIEPYERAEEGVVIERGSLLEVEGGDFILCRNNLPLFEVFIQLLTVGKRVRIMGKDFGKSLQLLLDNVSESPDEAGVTEALVEVLNKKYLELKDKGIRNPTTNKAFINLQEKVAILKNLIFAFQFNLSKVKSVLEDAFSENPDRKDIVLSTIHKAKGLEADNVFLLGANELIPSQYAETQLELYQEKCLLYVALTRAKKKLVIVPYIKK
jgi:superfamily I DNA/RNA helicase